MARNQAGVAFLALLSAALGTGCGGSSTPLAGGPVRTPDFPTGNAFIFGSVLDGGTGAGLANMTVTITPYEGGAPVDELESPTQAAAPSNRRGEFAFSGIAPGAYLLFIRFDTGRLGYGEVVGVVQATPAPVELTLVPPAIDLDFLRPADAGVVAAADTAVLTFQRFRVDELLTLRPETRPLFARVDVFQGSGGGGGGDGGGAGPRPQRFEVALDSSALHSGRVQVPLQIVGAGALRLESSLGLEVVYRDPGGGSPLLHVIPGETISVVRR